jgi:hypothetical protein
MATDGRRKKVGLPPTRILSTAVVVCWAALDCIRSWPMLPLGLSACI